MDRYKFASQFTDEEKLAYFKRKSAEAHAANDFATGHRYAVYAFNLEKRMEREIRERAEDEKRKVEAAKEDKYWASIKPDLSWLDK